MTMLDVGALELGAEPLAELAARAAVEPAAPRRPDAKAGPEPAAGAEADVGHRVAEANDPLAHARGQARPPVVGQPDLQPLARGRIEAHAAAPRACTTTWGTPLRWSRKRSWKRPWRRTFSKPAVCAITSQVPAVGIHQVLQGESPRNSAPCDEAHRGQAAAVLLGHHEQRPRTAAPCAPGPASGRAGGSAPSRRRPGRSGPPRRSGVASYTDKPTRSTSLPSACARSGRCDRARRPRPGAGGRPVELLGAVQVEARDLAPRRSISNAQKPSKVPTSSTRMPLRSSGRP